jgi:hypothetical protein
MDGVFTQSDAVKDLLYVFAPSKQITSRFFVAEFILSMAEGLLRMTLRQVPRATGGKPTTQFSKETNHDHASCS